MSRKLPVAVIGAGPVGLAAGAHLLSRGETPLETGPGAGHAVRQWGPQRGAAAGEDGNRCAETAP